MSIEVNWGVLRREMVPIRDQWRVVLGVGRQRENRLFEWKEGWGQMLERGEKVVAFATLTSFLAFG